MKDHLLALKAQMLCQGVGVDDRVEELFREQNPSGVKRGGLSSGGKLKLVDGPFVNAPFYRQRQTELRLVINPVRDQSVLVMRGDRVVCEADMLQAPAWYSRTVGSYQITQILTAHNRQLAGAVYEDCALFAVGEQCRFCVINRSLKNRTPDLILKKSELVLAALECIPLEQYGGLTLNGGMTFHPGRGIELIEPLVRSVHAAYPQLPIAVEITPPSDLGWIDRLAEAGAASLMMNLECWDPTIRERLIPGKNRYCNREMYLMAFERALRVLGPGRITTCFVVGTELIKTLKEGIQEVANRGVIPSPLAGRYFEDIPDYPFVPDVDWREFLDVLCFTADCLRRQGIISADKAGCVACGMCDLIKDLT